MSEATSRSKVFSNWQRFRGTKAYDLLAGAPLLVWYLFGLSSFYPKLSGAFMVWHIAPGALNALVAINLATAGLYTLLLFLLVLLRKPPFARSQKWLPRAAAFLGANLTVSYAFVPLAHPAMVWQALSTSLSLLGTAGALLATLWLGRAFCLMPEARVLKTRGPYRVIRHPVYLTEMIASIGLMMQFRQPWSFLITAAIVTFQFLRMHYEEQVLSQNFPAYAAYMQRTSRLIPGLY